MIHATSPIPTRIVLLGTERNLCLTIFTCNTHITDTCNEDRTFSGNDVAMVKGKTQEDMERRSRKGSSCARSEEMERAGDR
jgi:hypothetical protein